VKFRVFLIFALLGVYPAACSSSSGHELEIQEPWVRAAAMMDMQSDDAQDTGESEMPPDDTGHMSGANTGAFMIIKNSGNLPDKLVAAESDVAENVEIHLSEMQEDVMIMRQVDGVDIPANGQAELKPGGYHIMLIGINRELKEDDVVSLTLVFERSDNITVEAEVRMP
jgi:copper(I)-binding protein